MKALLVLPLVGVLGSMQGDPSDFQLSSSASGKSSLDLLSPRDVSYLSGACKSIGKGIADAFTVPDKYKGEVLATAIPSVLTMATAYGTCAAVGSFSSRSEEEIGFRCKNVGIAAFGIVGLVAWSQSGKSVISPTATATRFSTVTVTATQMPIRYGSYGIAINDRICADVQRVTCPPRPSTEPSKWLGQHEKLTVLEHNDGSGRRSITTRSVNSPHGWIVDHNVTINPDNTGSARVVITSPVEEQHFGPGLKVIYKFNKLQQPARVDLAGVEALAANFGLDWAERAMSDNDFGTYFGVADFGPDINLSFAIVPEDGRFDDSYQDVDICGSGG